MYRTIYGEALQTSRPNSFDETKNKQPAHWTTEDFKTAQLSQSESIYHVRYIIAVY